MASRLARKAIARKRLENILGAYTVALTRTLEQKIADAGPGGQRIDPHIITEARNELINDGRIIRIAKPAAHWFHLDDANPDELGQRLGLLEAVHNATSTAPFTKRMGQALEVAIYRTFLLQNTLQLVGRFPDLDQHDDSTLFRKEEPPSGINSRIIPGAGRLDFLALYPAANCWAGIEAKNIREWLYPDRPEIKDLLFKCCHLDVVPVLIARRIPYVTHRLLHSCGVLTWQTLRQRYPATDQVLASQARDKMLLGFHDIVLGNHTDPTLQNFIHSILPTELPAARERFQEHKDLLSDYARSIIPYHEFAARVRRREDGTNEDHDWDEYK